MRKTIVRTIATSTVKAFKMVVVDGSPNVEELEPVTVLGKATQEKAMKALKEKYGKNTPLTITGITVQEDTYEISVEDFLKYATKLENGSEGSETVEEGSEGSETATEN